MCDTVCSLVASLTGEMAARSFAYHAHGTADSDKSCCYICSKHAQDPPPPPIINHLASEGKTNHNIMMVSLLFYRKTNGRRTDGFKRTVHEEED